MPRAHHLLWLPFPAMRCSPEHPLVARADRIQRIPELSGNSGVGRVLQQACTLAILDLPSRLAAELEVVAFVVDGPGAVGLHVDAVVRRSDELLAGEGLLPRHNADIGHADDRQPVPA